MASPEPIPITRVTPEARRITEIQLDPTKNSGGIFEDDSHTDNLLLRNGWITLRVNKHSTNVSGFLEDIG